jgi:hypothetical protein
MEVGKFFLGASLVVMALFFVYGNNAVAVGLPADPNYHYAAAAVAGILGIALLIIEMKIRAHARYSREGLELTIKVGVLKRSPRVG